MYRFKFVNLLIQNDQRDLFLGEFLEIVAFRSLTGQRSLSNILCYINLGVFVMKSCAYILHFERKLFLIKIRLWRGSLEMNPQYTGVWIISIVGMCELSFGYANNFYTTSLTFGHQNVTPMLMVKSYDESVDTSVFDNVMQIIFLSHKDINSLITGTKRPLFHAMYS